MLGCGSFGPYGTSAGIQAKHLKKLRFQLAALDSAQNIDDLDILGYKLHSLKGQREGIWSITVLANWRLTFKFANGNVHILDHEDYH